METDSASTGKSETRREEAERGQSPTRIEVSDFQGKACNEELRPPLPPRPGNLEFLRERSYHPARSLSHPKDSTRPQLQSKATTAVSKTDIHTQSYQDGSRETYAASSDSISRESPRNPGSVRRFMGQRGNDGSDSASLTSFTPTLNGGTDVESLLGEVLGAGPTTPAWKLLSSQKERANYLDSVNDEEHEVTGRFIEEFEELGEAEADGSNEEDLLNCWKSKQKHFLILSSAGKPIYNRHGDNNLVSGYIGIVQTIISFYEGASDHLKGFTAGGARFVIMSEGSLYLVAISKLDESDSQLRAQLEALYMQILSTLTLPTLTHLFSNRPSTDLRRPLQGTEPLLSALADTFTRGSPPTLLSALECLKIRKSHRQIINNTLLKSRCDSLLYGLVVAGGRLVSVIRPKRHSLHPGDLQLIFNMLFEAGGIKAAGGENWIPLCLPGFNKRGYLYMYVSFLDSDTGGKSKQNKDDESGRQDQIAILLISASKEAFYDLRKMQDAVVDGLERNGSMAIIKAAVQRGRPAATDIVPGTVLRHFLYKSRGNVQFTMPSYEPHFNTLLERRRLLSLYHTLNASVHAKTAHLKVHHCVSRSSISLAWVTPLFELYCVAGSNASRSALAQSANKVIQWVRREEERVFIIGGAIF